ncbi:unnamed protein product [Orchesella dallaii]|uniref:C2H2-type domain-containing protein n=1 Tax=Orchesella dallaii TaxID=48710 RepID=A0ABP1SB22_9HEXA
MLNMNALSNQLGIGSLPQLEGFRTSLAQKCHSKRKQTLPNVLLTSRRLKEQIDTTENVDSSFLHNLEQIKVDVDPFDLVEMEADNNALDLEPSPSSVEGQNGEEEAIGRIPVGSVLKFVTLHDDMDAEELLELPSTRVNNLDLEVIPAAVQAMTWVDGIFSNGYQCPKCSEVLRDEQKYHDHYRYHHQEAGIYPCQLCSRVYDTPLQLKKHVLNEASQCGQRRGSSSCLCTMLSTCFFSCNGSLGNNVQNKNIQTQ